MPKVSVIMPAYNAEKYIAEAIESVLSQTFQHIELIIVDDGSTDGTREIVGKYTGSRGDCFASPLRGGLAMTGQESTSDSCTHAPMHSRTDKGSPGHQVTKSHNGEPGSQGHIVTRSQVSVKYFRQENKGPAAARNRGIQEAQGDYIAFIDSDDLWLPDKLDKQMSLFKRIPECGLIHSERIKTDLEGKILPSRKIAAPQGMVFENLLENNFICTSSVVAQKACFERVGIFDEDRSNRSEDYDMWLRIAYQWPMEYIPEALVKHRINPNGYNRSHIKVAYDSETSVFLKAIELYQGDKEAFKRKRLHQLMYKKGHSLLCTDDFKNSSHSFFQAWQYRKTSITSLLFCLVARTKAVLNNYRRTSAHNTF